MKITNAIKFVRSEYIKRRAYRQLTSEKFVNCYPEFRKESEYLRKVGMLKVFPYAFTEMYCPENYKLKKNSKQKIKEEK